MYQLHDTEFSPGNRVEDVRELHRPSPQSNHLGVNDCFLLSLYPFVLFKAAKRQASLSCPLPLVRNIKSITSKLPFPYKGI